MIQSAFLSTNSNSAVPKIKILFDSIFEVIKSINIASFPQFLCSFNQETQIAAEWSGVESAGAYIVHTAATADSK